MKSLETYLLGSAVLIVGLAGMTGCGQPAPPAYPVSPPSVTPPPATEPVATSTQIKVPSDAVELSHGDYPPPGFPAPNQPGLIMVIDLDGDPTVAVASTAVTGMDAGKMMSITDVTNMTATMNKLHKYRIVFVPKTKMP